VIGASRHIDRRALLLGAAAACLGGGALAAVPAPRIGRLTKVPRHPYDAGRDADTDVKAAAARAKAAGKLLLIDFGANWCADCLILAGIMEMPEAKAFLDRHYEIVHVEVGRMDRNLHIAARYGMAGFEGVPAVVVVSPKGKVLNRGDVFVLANARAMSDQAVMDKLASWVP